MLTHSESQLRQVSRMTGGQVYKYTYFQVREAPWCLTYEKV